VTYTGSPGQLGGDKLRRGRGPAARPNTAPTTDGRNHKIKATVGTPDGPAVFRPEFGKRVETFKSARKDLDSTAVSKAPCLMFHVPHEMRGPYRPQQLPTFTGEPDDYETDADGYMICEDITKQDKACKRRAENRQRKCGAHGARLHPLDKAAPVVRTDVDRMTRYELLRHGYLDVSELTDDELRNGVSPRAGVIQLPKPIYQALIARHFERAQELLAEGLLPAISALGDIASNEHDIYEAADRIKASVFIIERVLGKNPIEVHVGVAKEPWEQLVEGLAPMTRAESRRGRGLPEDSEDEIHDAELVGDMAEVVAPPPKRKAIRRKPTSVT
jgi:hypothetical protein